MRMVLTTTTTVLLSMLTTACGDSGGSGDGGGGCDGVPTCYQEALAGLRACVTSPTPALGSVTERSGTVPDLQCTDGEFRVAFSTFSARPGGTVPTPSGVTFYQGDNECAELSITSGMRTADGTSDAFEGSIIDLADGSRAQVNFFESGAFEIRCGSREDTRFFDFAPGSLGSCADALALQATFRDDDITAIGVTEFDVDGASEVLVQCQ